MALLYQESFDSENDTFDLTTNCRFRELENSNVGVGTVINTSGGRFGGGCYIINTSSFNPTYAPLEKPCTNTTIRMAWSMRVNNANTGSATGARWIAGLKQLASDGTFTRHFNVYILGNVIVCTKYDDANIGTVVGTATTNINDNAWHHYEFELLAHTSAGVIKVWVDGNLEINISGDTSDAASGDVTGFTHVMIGGSSNIGGTVDMKWDDVIVWDDASGGLTGHLSSPHRLSTVVPNAAGDDTDFTPSAGNNYDCVNAVLTNDDTNYVQNGTPGDRDLYNVGSLSTNPVSIFAVALEHWARKEDIGPLTYKTAVKSDGTLDYGSTITPTNGYIKRWDEWLDPDGDVAWTKAALEASQIGVEIVS